MKDDMIVLLEWLYANGITDVCGETSITALEIEKPASEVKNDRSMENVLETLARRQSRNYLPNEAMLYARNVVDNINNIDDLREALLNFDACDSLKKLSINTVFFDGNSEADVLFVNDIPNEVDDEEGKVFSGESGILMEKMLKAIDLSPDNCCFANTLFWRLAGNRPPIKAELEICRPFTEKLIALVKPKVIVFTGNYGLSVLGAMTDSILKARGKFFDYSNCYLLNNIKAFSLYNPNFLLKNPTKKREAWNDLLILKEFLQL